MKVLNKYHAGIPKGAVYIGRGSPWGNPFIIGKDGTRDEVIAKYEAYLDSNPKLLSRIGELRRVIKKPERLKLLFIGTVTVIPFVAIAY